MLTQTGPFSIPVRCTTRKCIVRATGSEGDGGGEEDSVEVDFGRVCVGETVRRSILLHNDGALPTEFSITPSTCSEPKVSSSAYTLHKNPDIVCTIKNQILIGYTKYSAPKTLLMVLFVGQLYFSALHILSLLIQSSEREVNESVAESVSGASSSQSSLPSVMSEVRGDWGAVARLKSSHRVLPSVTDRIVSYTL